jgi:hypothetical protein
MGESDAQGRDERDEAALRFDYGETSQLIRQLADIRFRLLAAVPAIAALAVGLLSRAPAPAQLLAVGLVGLLATLGIFAYELHNTRLYDAAIARASRLEQLLALPATDGGGGPGGLYSERPRRAVSLFGVIDVQDGGLALVYAAALGAWAYLVVWGLLARLHVDHAAAYGTIGGFVFGGAVLYEAGTPGASARRRAPRADG